MNVVFFTCLFILCVVESGRTQHIDEMNGLFLGQSELEVQDVIRRTDWGYIKDDCDSTYITEYGWANLAPEQGRPDSINVIACNDSTRRCAVSRRTVVHFRDGKLSSIVCWGDEFYSYQFDSVRAWAVTVEQALRKQLGKPKNVFTKIDTVTSRGLEEHGRIIAEWMIPRNKTKGKIPTVIALSVGHVQDRRYGGILFIMDEQTYRKGFKKRTGR